MTPKLLVLQAYTAFAERQLIDFRRLGERKLMMISGDTGAGKTAILDAMTYALFGQTSGGARTERSLRSDHARAGMSTFVDFRFELHGTYFRVLRKPPQPGKLTGLAELYELIDLDDENGKPKEVGKSRVDQFIRNLLGYSVEQFRSVVVLPQGQFRQFLNSKTRDKASLLSTLFATERFTTLQNLLKKQADEAGRAQSDNQARIEQSLKVAGVQNRREMFEISTLLRTELGHLQSHRERSTATLKIQERSLAQGRSLLSRFEELETVNAQIEELASKSADMGPLQRRIDEIDAALHLRSDHRRFLEKKRSHDEAKIELDGATIELRQLEERYQQLATAHAEMDRKKPMLETWAGEIRGLTEMIANLDRYHTAKQIYRSQSERRAALAQALRVAQMEQANAIERAANLDEAFKQSELAIQQGRDSANATEAYKLRLLDAHTFREMTEGLTSLDERVAAQTDLGKKIEVRLDELRGDYERVHQSHMSAYAARLAEHLTSGAPCPVCGSLDHPDKTKSDTHGASVQDVKRALSARESQEQALAEQEGLLHRLMIERVALLEKLQSSAYSSIDRANEAAVEITAKLEQLDSLIKEGQTAERKLQTLTETRAQQRTQVVDLQQRAKDAESALAQHEQLLSAQTARIDERRQKLPEIVPEEAEVKEQLEAISARRDRLEAELRTTVEGSQRAAQARAAGTARVQSATAALKNAQLAESQAQRDYQAALADSVFATEIEYENALSHADQLSSMRARLAEYTTRKERYAGIKNHLEHELRDETRPDVDALLHVVERTLVTVETLGNAIESLNSELAPLRRAQDEIESLSRERDAREQEFRVLASLRDVALGKGPNRLGMQFEKYVLASILDGVLYFANEHLSLMSGGRYIMQRKDPDRPRTTAYNQDKRSESGLEVEIVDAYTGRERDSTTLSGGEGFQASLALALGLADVVQTNAGGIELHSMFIDEGFGTQSEDALDAVMETLLRLQSDGRLVGVISHVRELRSRIGARLHVHKGTTGSRVNWVIGNQSPS